MIYANCLFIEKERRPVDAAEEANRRRQTTERAARCAEPETGRKHS